MIKVYISGNRADVTEREPLTSGTVGKVLNFAFTEDWRLLIKYAVFEGSGRRIALTNIGDSCIIPHEVLAKHGGALRVGVYGRTADGSAATPTVYAQLGIIQRGADPNADPSTKPTLPVWAQIQAQIGDLADLTTTAKDTLVAAINEAARSGGGGGGSTVELDTTLTQSGKAADAKAVGDAIRSLSEEKVNRSALSLGFGTDGKLYIMVSGVAIGDGVEINGSIEPSEGVVVFAADFSGLAPSADQFYSWEGRIYDNAIYDALQNIKCTDGVAVLTSVYDSANSRWTKQMMCTGGIFEADNFTCKFRAKFSGLAGSWHNIITYGTGTHWTNGIYSDGVKWPAGGEIDAFEQAGGYADVPNTMHTPTGHYGSGTNSGYPNTHQSRVTGTVEFTTDEWHDFKFSLNSGYVKVWIDDVLVGENDFSDCIVSNNYMADYAPFLKPQAFYIDGSCASGAGAIDTSNVYKLEVSDFKIIQDAYVECTGLEIFPQMWARGTELVFPVGAELYLDRVYTPANTSNKACVWNSSNEAVATVVQGYVKVLAEGEATITATCGGASASYALTASNSAANVPCAKVAADKENGITVGDTKTVSITAYLYPSFTTDDVSWATSDPGVATVENGVVSGVAVGKAYITVTCGAKSTVVPVDVVEAAKPYVRFDFTGLQKYYYALKNDANASVTLKNQGSGGSQFDFALTAKTTTYDKDGNYNPAGFVESYYGQTTALDATINLKAQPMLYVWTVGDSSSIARQYNNKENGNIMPSLDRVYLRYGVVTNVLTVTFTGNDKLLVYSDGAGKAYAYQNGTLLASGTNDDITDAFSNLIFKYLNGFNFTNFEMYLGTSFTEAELIAMSTPQ